MAVALGWQSCFKGSSCCCPLCPKPLWVFNFINWIVALEQQKVPVTSQVWVEPSAGSHPESIQERIQMGLMVIQEVLSTSHKRPP